jgi:hypothetical protein
LDAYGQLLSFAIKPKEFEADLHGLRQGTDKFPEQGFRPLQEIVVREEIDRLVRKQ